MLQLSQPIFLTTLTLLLLIPAFCQLDPSRLRIVDSDNTHFLVRGNLPIKDNQFQFEELYGELEKLTGLSNFRLMTYSLLNFLTAKQTKNRYIEQNFFSADGSHITNQHHFYNNHDIIGSLLSPSATPAFLRPFLIKFYNITTYDRIPQLLSAIHRNMNSPVPTVVYIHCSQGIDRAGYIAGAYKMKYLGARFQDIVQENLGIMKGIRGYIHFNSFYAMQWYCLFLGRTSTDCLVGLDGASAGATWETAHKGKQKNVEEL